jgi:hypothetical protein
MEEMTLNVTLDAIYFNPVVSTILKWLRFKAARLMHYLYHSALLNNGLGLFALLGFRYITYSLQMM